MPDRLLLLADAGSTHTQRWATEFARRGYDVHVASLRDRAIPGVTVHPLRPAKAGKLGAKSGKGFYDYSPKDLKEILARRDRILLKFRRVLKEHGGG